MFGGTYWTMSSEDDLKGREAEREQNGGRPLPPGINWTRAAELLLPVILASGMTGLTTIAVLGERIDTLKESQRLMQDEIRELRRDLYLPRGHSMRVPYYIPPHRNIAL